MFTQILDEEMSAFSGGRFAEASALFSRDEPRATASRSSSPCPPTKSSRPETERAQTISGPGPPPAVAESLGDQTQAPCDEVKFPTKEYLPPVPVDAVR